MSAWDIIPDWEPIDPAKPIDAVYLRNVNGPWSGEEPTYRLVRVPVIGEDTRDRERIVTDPADDTLLVRPADVLFNDGSCLYLGLYAHGRQPSWAALEGAKAILSDRGAR